jgi:hypothetical protein
MICPLCEKEVRTAGSQIDRYVHVVHGVCDCIEIRGTGSSPGHAGAVARERFLEAVERKKEEASRPRVPKAGTPRARWKRKALRLKRARLYN